MRSAREMLLTSSQELGQLVPGAAARLAKVRPHGALCVPRSSGRGGFDQCSDCWISEAFLIRDLDVSSELAGALE